MSCCYKVILKMKQGIKYNQKKKKPNQYWTIFWALGLHVYVFQDVPGHTTHIFIVFTHEWQASTIPITGILYSRPDLIKQPLQSLLSYPLKIGLPAFMHSTYQVVQDTIMIVAMAAQMKSLVYASNEC